MVDSGYYLDLSAFSLEKLREQIKITRMLPSQQILLEDIDRRFAQIENEGIENLQQLQKTLKTKTDVQTFAQVTAIPADYLTILRRQVNSYQPKPIKLADFPGVDLDDINKLAQIGIKNTKQYFPHIRTKKDRSDFASRYQVSRENVLEITKLSDVARLKWVGPKFARLLVESKYDTVAKIAASDYEELYHHLAGVNEEKGIYNGGIGIDDMRIWVEIAVQDVPQVIQY